MSSSSGADCGKPQGSCPGSIGAGDGLEAPRSERLRDFAKRAVDLALAGFGLAASFPLLLLVAICVKLDSAGPVFFRGRRAGRNGSFFYILKFRSMEAAASRVGPRITTQDDPRVTRLGRFLRKTKLDELPQLINVLRGDMSLVGPRPEDPRYVARYTPEQLEVLTVRPGISSPASLLFRDESSLLSGEEWEKIYVDQILPRKLAVEIAYLKRRTLWSDLAIIMKTLLALFR